MTTHHSFLVLKPHEKRWDLNVMSWIAGQYYGHFGIYAVLYTLETTAPVLLSQITANYTTPQ